MSKYVIEDTTLIAIGDAIREKDGSTEQILVSELANKIKDIPQGGGGGDLPAEAIEITGDCDYKFAYNGWNWFINEFKNKIKTKDVGVITYMFGYSTKLEQIPFDLNMDPTLSGHVAGNAFNNCVNLKQLPNIYNFKPNLMVNIFNNCQSIRNLPDNILNWDMSPLMSSGNSVSGMFTNCYSLRQIPGEFLKKCKNTSTSRTTTLYYNLNYIYSLDEITCLPVPVVNFTSNIFSSGFSELTRVKEVTFETNADGSPISATWKNQTIDLTSGIGYYLSIYKDPILKSNSGITADKEVNDDATYQALKNDPDWFATRLMYSRYNHDSAVNTINSLPDVSSGSGNSIKFDGGSGASTDGGAIRNLTEEEIAVAAAKGWTVTLV